MRNLEHHHRRILAPFVTSNHCPVPAADRTKLSLSKPGDYVTLKAEMDCDVIVCYCAQDIVPINCGNPTPLAIGPARRRPIVAP